MTQRARLARFTLPLFAIGLIAIGAQRAASSPSVVDGLRGCAAQRDSAQRLDCFDRLAQRVAETTAGATSPRAGQPASAPSHSASDRPPSTGIGAPAERPSAVAAIPTTRPAERQGGGPLDTHEAAEFGARGGPLAERREARGPREISALVTRIGHQSYGQLIITLDNGQVWLQREPTDYFPLKTGDSVVIRKAAFGSFLLFAPFKRSTRVTRIR